jgi:hypothetical protein
LGANVATATVLGSSFTKQSYLLAWLLPTKLENASFSIRLCRHPCKHTFASRAMHIEAVLKNRVA